MTFLRFFLFVFYVLRLSTVCSRVWTFSAWEVATLRRYTNVFIIVLFIYILLLLLCITLRMSTWLINGNDDGDDDDDISEQQHLNFTQSSCLSAVLSLLPSSLMVLVHRQCFILSGFSPWSDSRLYCCWFAVRVPAPSDNRSASILRLAARPSLARDARRWLVREGEKRGVGSQLVQGTTIRRESCLRLAFQIPSISACVLLSVSMSQSSTTKVAG